MAVWAEPIKLIGRWFVTYDINKNNADPMTSVKLSSARSESNSLQPQESVNVDAHVTLNFIACLLIWARHDTSQNEIDSAISAETVNTDQIYI